MKIVERLRSLLHAFVHPEYDADEETVKILRAYIGDPGFQAYKQSFRVVTLTTPQPCTRCGSEETVLIHPQSWCGLCLTQEFSLLVVEPPAAESIFAEASCKRK